MSGNKVISLSVPSSFFDLGLDRLSFEVSLDGVVAVVPRTHPALAASATGNGGDLDHHFFAINFTHLVTMTNTYPSDRRSPSIDLALVIGCVTSASGMSLKSNFQGNGGTTRIRAVPVNSPTLAVTIVAVCS